MQNYETSPEYILNCQHVSKSFGGTQALKDVTLQIKPGQIHALMGENGAGKSTLMKIIMGLIKADQGTIIFDGEPYAVAGPSEAAKRGISMIHQELNPQPYLSISETIFLKREDTYPNSFFLNKKETNRRAAELLDRFHMNLNPKTVMGELTLAQCQMVEIIKAVSYDSKMVIMDEPTSSLDSEETERLFETIQTLREQGVTVVYISHRMEEIFRICDSYTVFRDGTYVGSGDIKDVTANDLIAMMVGRTVENIFPKVDCPIGEEVFRVEGLSGTGFDDISFAVHAGEILGLSGLVGSGRSETMSAIFGLTTPTKGKMYLNGQEITNRNSDEAIRKGIVMVNEDRKNYGLCLFRSIRENIALPTLWKKQPGIFINQRKEKTMCAEIAEQLLIKMATQEDNAFSLSGGNQQKVVLAKWMLSDPKLLILDEPTRGVDVYAKSEIHTLICKLAAQGVAIILVSSELPEVIGMSDRILVYHEGHLNGEVLRKDILSGAVTREDILEKEFGHKEGGN